ncbi:MAG: tRNA epoxyqueuosine(34) reductase QueG [Nitrospirota bacterium]|nr:tRNA epoxyqueuosine(34) reductase QueG [Nitrospirota bacterium]
MCPTRTATTADPAASAAAIRAHGLKLGLQKVGFAPASAAAEAAPRHAQWIAAGHHGGMDWLARRADDRADPSRLLPGLATCIVVLETTSPPGDVFGELADPTRAYFARYARGADYHDRLKERLTDLAAFVESRHPGCHTRVYVDTGPLPEKALAQAAGIGWQGRHTNLVDPTGGNWTALGVILTDLPLPPDAPHPDRCGTCTDCVDICPTSAFVAPRVLDARRCVSYLTIELKGPIPEAFRPLIGNRVFGCDDCLAVCPWNRFSQAAHDTAYAARELTAGTPLVDLLTLTPQAFNRHFKGTPIQRTKRRGLLRNVAVALGNSGDQSAVPHLVRALADAEPLVRGHAAWALGRLGGAHEALTARLAIEDDLMVRQELHATLPTPG